jgi:outer membrane protein assembly factor BamA
MRNQLFFSVLIAGLLGVAVWARAEESFTHKSLQAMAQTDAIDVLGFRAAGTTVTALAKKGDLVVVPGPYIGYNPTAGTILGVGMNALFYLGDPEVTPLSTIDNLIAYTSTHQFMFYSKSTVQTDQRDWEFQGDWRYYITSQPTYGLSTNPETPVSGGFLWFGQETTGISGGQDMKFDFIRFRETAFRRIFGDAFVGLGYNLDIHKNIVDQPLAAGAAPPTITSHYAYSTYYGYDPTGYVTSGVSLNFLIDSRDDVLHPYQGQYALLSYTWNSPLLGSSQASQAFYGEYRQYLPLAPDKPQNVLGFWAFLNLGTSGALPYLDLPANGYDQRERSGRGYAQGRWRGDDLAYAETEYRFPLGWNGLLGGVVFANAVTTSRQAVNDPTLGPAIPSVDLFEYIKPALGAGLRLLFVKDIRMNVELDFAKGVDGSSGLYVNLFEIF